MGVVRILVIFQDIGQCSAISLKISWRDISTDVAEHKAMLKNRQNTQHTRLNFTPKSGIAFLKTGVLFLLCIFSIDINSIKS